MLIRKHAGSLDDSMATAKEIPNTLSAVREYAKAQTTYLPFTEEELNSFAIEVYSGPDERIGWNATFIVTYISRESGNRAVFGFTDSAPEEGVYAKLLNLDSPTRGGKLYSTAVMLDAVNRFNASHPQGFFGEMKNPDVTKIDLDTSADLTPSIAIEDLRMKRAATIEAIEVSHHGTGMRIEDGFIVANVKPDGIAAGYMEMLQNCGKLHFAMRAFVSYAPRLPMDKGPVVVDRCDIVTFDLCDRPL